MKKIIIAIGVLNLACNLWSDPMWASDFKEQYLAVPQGTTHMSLHFYVVTTKFGKEEENEEEALEVDYGPGAEKLTERHLTFKDSKEYTLQYDYDEIGKLVAENALRADGSKVLMTRFEYGKNTKSEYSCLGEDRVLSATETRYDDLGRDTEWTWYDADGKVSVKSITQYLASTKTTHSYGSDGDEYEKRVYDYLNGKLNAQRIYKVASKQPDLLQFVTEYGYDSKGLLTLESRKNIIEKTSSQTQYSYNGTGLVTERLDINEENAIRTEYAYDSLGVLVSIKQSTKDAKFGKSAWNLMYLVLRELDM